MGRSVRYMNLLNLLNLARGRQGVCAPESVAGEVCVPIETPSRTHVTFVTGIATHSRGCSISYKSYPVGDTYLRACM
jgi:hypothetical protein